MVKAVVVFLLASILKPFLPKRLPTHYLDTETGVWRFAGWSYEYPRFKIWLFFAVIIGVI